MKRFYLKPLLEEQLGKDFKIISKLYGGMMNVSYLVEDKKHHKYIVYIPNGLANKAVDRKIEKENTKIMEDLGLTSKVIYFDDVRGIKIKEYIEGESLDKYPGWIDYQAVADLLHLIHDAKPCPNEYNPFQRLANYENKAISYVREKNDYRYLKDFLATNIKLLQAGKITFSHNDFQKSNIIISDDEKYSVIDFEFAGNNDEVYDIATFANNSIKEGETLLDYYFNHKPTLEQKKRFYLWRIFISLQWHVVAISKHYQKEGKNTKYNFLEVADYFLDNAKQAKEKFDKLG